LKEQAIEIVAQRPSIAVTSTQQGGSVSKEQMNLIPYGRNQRTFDAVATSIPGVQTDALGGIAMNGSGGPESNYIIDGVNVSDPAFGTLGTTLIQDFVQEVDIKTGGYQAEYGRATGGIINVVTKSGGNEFHGSVFVNWSPLEASRKQIGNLGEAIRSQVSQRYNLDFGAELGGPIIKDKLWFFAGFAPALVSRNLERIISARTADAAGNPVLDANGNPATTEVARKKYTATTTSYNLSGKLTYLINENHSIALAGYGNPNSSSGVYTTNRSTLAGLAGTEGSFLIDHDLGSLDSSLRYSGKLFNKTMLVEATAAYHHQRDRDIPIGVDGQSATAVADSPSVSWRGTRNLVDPHFLADPMVPDYQKSAAVLAACTPVGTFNPCPVTNYFTGGASFLNNATLDRIGGVLKLSNFVELAGHHQFKYGVDASRDTYDQQKTYSGGAALRVLTSGLIQYFRAYGHADPARPGQAALDPNDPNRFADPVASNKTRNTSIAFFAQDTWNVFDRVVLDVGVRGEKQLMYSSNNTFIDINGVTHDGAGINLTNWAPRLGLIYDFTGRGLSKVYTSYGRFYEYIPLDLADRALSAETQVDVRKDPTNCVNPNDLRTCATVPNGIAGRTFNFTGGAAGTNVDPNLKGQYTDEYLAGVQYQVYRDITVGVDYTHKQIGRVIEDMSVDDGNTYFLSNPGEPGGAGFQATTGNGVTIVEPKPRRIYDGITLSVNKTFAENWLMTASYTYSSFRGNYPGLFSIRGTGAPQLDPNILSEYDLLSLLPNKDGPLPGDVPNSFKLDAGYVYELSPRMTFNFGGNARADQGQPLNYLGAHPLYGSGEAYILPRGSAGRLPWTWQLNLRGGMSYKVSKDYALGVTVDVFNVTNNQRPLSVDQNYTFDSVSPIVNGKVADLPNLRSLAPNGGPGPNAVANTNFLNATSYQLPFSARIGAKLSF
jgi:hypothetical protein